MMQAVTPESRSPLSPVVLPPVDTSTNVESPMRLHTDDEAQNREAWEDLINSKLIEWGRDPGQFDEEGIQPPARETISRAVHFARRLAAKPGCVVPTRSVPDVHGGIVFEYEHDKAFVSIHIQADGTDELRIFANHQLVAREPIADDE